MRYKAEIFDKLQYLYHITGFNDHQLHCVIKFDGKINIHALEKAAALLLDTVPILSTVYKNIEDEPYWEKVDPVRWPGLLSVVENEDAFNEFTFSKTDESSGPQIRLCLLNSRKDALSIIMNHMICDAAGFKQCIYLISDLYNKLLDDPQYRPDAVFDGDRSFRSISQQYSFVKKLRIFLSNRNDNNQKTAVRFPLNTDVPVSPFILTHEIAPERYRLMRSLCEKYNTTVNDVVLTAYFRALSKMLKSEGKTLSLPMMVDMRRYLDDRSYNTFTNISSTVFLTIAVPTGETFADTLVRVSGETGSRKSDNLGLNTFIKLDLIFKLFGNKLACRIIERNINNPDICITNIGILDSSRLYFAGTPILNAFICGSIKYRPHFQMACSTFGEMLTLSVNLYGSAADRRLISEFFTLADKELP